MNLNLRKTFLILIAGTLISACSFLAEDKKFYVEQAPNNQCCAVRSGNGECTKELVPGCATNSSPLFKEQFLAPDDCCAYWGVDGMCYEELIKDCSSQRRF